MISYNELFLLNMAWRTIFSRWLFEYFLIFWREIKPVHMHMELETLLFRNLYKNREETITIN